jgi:hypothetical protein
MGIWPVVKAAFEVVRDPRHRYYYRQRRVENIEARERWAARVAQRLPVFSGEASDLAGPLQRDGIAHLPQLLSSDQVRAMRTYFEGQRSSDPYRPRLGSFIAPKDAPKETHVAFFSNEVAVEAPFGLKVANDSRVLSAVSAALGAKPTISYMTAWWSLPGHGEAEQAELFHRDYDDLRFVKLFLYLTDVDERSGPHAFVRGSHRNSKLLPRLRYAEEEVGREYPAEDHLRMEGKAGTAFLENTFGLHRGIPPVSKPRLIFQVLYSLRPFIGGPRRPLRTVSRVHEGTALDPYINRSYCVVR